MAVQRDQLLDEFEEEKSQIQKPQADDTHTQEGEEESKQVGTLVEVIDSTKLLQTPLTLFQVDPTSSKPKQKLAVNKKRIKSQVRVQSTFNPYEEEE